MKLSINFNNFYFYFLLWPILFLLGNYIGNFYSFLYIFLSTLITINLIHFIISINTLYYYQQFSTEHPFKGQQINYKLTIENRAFIQPCYITISYNDSIHLENNYPKIEPFKTVHFTTDFKLPFRGVYKVGIKNIVCSDFLKIFNYNLSFWPRTFYVYPRINSDITYKSGGSGSLAKNNSKISNNSIEFFDSIKKYTPGVNKSIISWKHFATIGEPLIKSFYTEEISQDCIFLDRSILPDYRLGPADDLALEVLFSLLQKNVNDNKKTFINCWSDKYINIDNFNSFYKDSIHINFNKTPMEVLLEFKVLKYKPNNRIVLITTFESSFFFDIEFLQKYKNITIYIITTNMEQQKKDLLSKSLTKFSNIVEVICLN